MADEYRGRGIEVFQAKQFLRDHFQSVGGIVAHCRAADVGPPNEAQAQKWFDRNSIPGDWLTTLLAVLEKEQGKPVSLAKYREGAL
jgi:hypothetical protein